MASNTSYSIGSTTTGVTICGSGWGWGWGAGVGAGTGACSWCFSFLCEENSIFPRTISRGMEISASS